MRSLMPTNNAVSLEPPKLDVDMLAATREFFKGLG
jgi:hypothetical protein